MDLVQAFRELQPLTPGLPAERVKTAQEAARVLFGELHQLAARESHDTGLGPSDCDSVVQTVLYRMVQSGPRGVREHDPQSYDAVRGWLTQAVRNAMRDMFRKNKRLVQPSSVQREGEQRDWMAEQPADDSVDDGVMIERLEQRRADGLVAQARTRLWRVLVPRAVARKEKRSVGAGARLYSTLEELRRAVEQSLDIGEVARQSLIAEGAEAEGKVLSRRRAALDKRFQRAREAVLGVIDEACDKGEVDEITGKALIFLVQDELYMQKRRDSVAARRRRSMTSPRHSVSSIH